MESLDEEAAAVRGRMQASREAFERGRREEREMIARTRPSGKPRTEKSRAA